MNKREEGINAMWEEVEKPKGAPAMDETGEESVPAEPAVLYEEKMHGILKTEIPAGSKIVVSLSNHTYSLRHTTGIKNKNGKKQCTVLCDELVFDEDGDHDIANGTIIDSIEVRDNVAYVVAPTRAGRRRRKDEQARISRKVHERRSTIEAVKVMIKKADKGPSGFWTDDYEGCGNPAVFSEFSRGLEHGEYVVKAHECCPWDTAIMYGDQKNVHSGCYYHCGIYRAKYLTADMLRDVLTRFLENLQAETYADGKTVSPLLTNEEKQYIKQAEEKKEQERERRYKQEAADRLAKADDLIKKYPDDKEWADLLGMCYGTKASVTCYDGIMEFDRDEISKTVGAGKMSYDEFLDLQKISMKTWRHGFAYVYSGGYFASYKGKIQNKTKDKVCFTRIYIEGEYGDGECFEDREEHVWMDAAGFETYRIGDCVAFDADVYRYVKTKHGRRLDFGLRNPECISKIEEYRIPSDDDLRKQAIDRLICDDLCMFREHCYMGNCIADEEWRNNMRTKLFAAAKLGDLPEEET